MFLKMKRPIFIRIKQRLACRKILKHNICNHIYWLSCKLLPAKDPVKGFRADATPKFPTTGFPGAQFDLLMSNAQTGRWDMQDCTYWYRQQLQMLQQSRNRLNSTVALMLTCEQSEFLSHYQPENHSTSTSFNFLLKLKEQLYQSLK